jgi:hypothetical protein
MPGPSRAEAISRISTQGLLPTRPETRKRLSSRKITPAMTPAHRAARQSMSCRILCEGAAIRHPSHVLPPGADARRGMLNPSRLSIAQKARFYKKRIRTPQSGCRRAR